MKYLFKAILKDGSLIEQTQEDKSSHTENRNCFYDVLQKMDEVIGFGMENTENNDQYWVNLQNGEFIINNAPFFFHEGELRNIRLIYFKRNYIHRNLVTQEETRQYSYHFGYQALNEKGENVQKVIALF